MAEDLAFPALADANRITMENHSLSQNTYFNKILLLFIASGQLSSPPATLRTPPSQPQLLAPAVEHCGTSAETSLQFSLYVPPPTFALCLLCFQKSKYSLFSAPPGCCERLKGWFTAPEVSAYSKDFFLLLLVTSKVQDTILC